MPKNLWNETQLIEVLKLYCLLPFGQIHARNPKIIELARLIVRTPNAVALKMVNFASLDPTIERRGMANVSALDRKVWEEFFKNMDKYIKTKRDEPKVGMSDLNQVEFEFEGRLGEDVLTAASRRKNQDFFREMILATYEDRCALTGIEAQNLLVASHIMPWAQYSDLRTNPHNGLCLNYLHDKAFEIGLIAFDESLSVLYSRTMPPETEKNLRAITFQKLTLPKRFQPNREFLAKHRHSRFRQ